jgi:ABC-type lipoprotein release transport system permease subunit
VTGKSGEIDVVSQTRWLNGTTARVRRVGMLATAVGMALIELGAGAIPARRASRIDSAQTLRF